MLILGIETSCDETAAAIVENGRVVRSSVVASQEEIHARYAGVVPELASRAHVERITPVLRKALLNAGVAWREIDAVAVGHRPGLIGSLLVGVSAAKAVAWSLGKPLIGVDHVQAHMYAGVLEDPRERSISGMNDPPGDLFPALGFVVSGGHTSLYRLDSWTEIKRLGGTIDDAMGEAFDKAAAILGIPFPGGPNLDRLASSEGSNDRAEELPVSRLGGDSLDFSFSGLKTALLYAARGVPASSNPRAARPQPAPELTPGRVRDLAASFQRAAVKAAIIKIQRALERLGSSAGGVRSLLVGGGVSANSRLRIDLEMLADKRGVRLVIPRMKFCVDNAAMIAGLAYHLGSESSMAGLALQASPSTSLAGANAVHT